MTVSVLQGDCVEVMAMLDADSFDAIVTDPPYELNFMGRSWDRSGVATQAETWAQAFRVLKPGAHLLAFGGTRTFHRIACAIEDAGFEIRDCVQWLYGSGFPKSHDVSKGIDRAAGATRDAVGIVERSAVRPDAPDQSGGKSYRLNGDTVLTRAATPEAEEWEGWGTALKPAWEPIILARKPLRGTVAANVLAFGTGALNIDASRVPTGENLNGGAYAKVGGRAESQSLHVGSGMNVAGKTAGRDYVQPEGRWPANVIHDGSDEVMEAFARFEAPGQQRHVGPQHGERGSVHCYGDYGARPDSPPRGDIGSAARFFYSAKADATDRLGSKHPTVKPVDLMRYLIKMVTPPGGHVLDPFAGSGTTGMGAMAEGFNATLIEREAEYVADIQRRIAHVSGSDAPLFAAAPRQAAIA